MGKFTDKEKLSEIDRELQLRQRVYRWMVSKGKLKKEDGDRQVQILAEIRMDYHAKVTAASHANPGPLFGEQQ
jgi:hypothetical protein